MAPNSNFTSTEPPVSGRDGLQEAEDFCFEHFDVGFDCLQWPRRFIAIEMAVERDFVPDLGLGGVNSRIGHVGQNLALEIHLNAFLEWDGLGIAQVGVRLGLAVSVAADFGGLIAFA